MLWSGWIALSRLYLGLHAPVDIIAGAVAGLTIVGCAVTVDDYVIDFVTASPWAVPAVFGASLVLLRLHPRPLQYTPTYEFTTSFVGAASGISVGMARCWADLMAPGILIHTLPFGTLWLLRRVVVGLGAAAAAKEAGKKLAGVLLPILYRGFPVTLRACWQPPVADLGAKLKKDPRLTRLPHTAGGRPWDVEITARYFSYFALAWMVSDPVPRLYQWAGW